MPYSIESRLGSTWPIEDVTLSLVQGLLACDAAEAKQRRDELAKKHRDPSWLDATVARLPVPALCIAATLAGRGGMLYLDELEKLVGVRFDLTREEIDGGTYALMRELLVAPLASARGELVALVTTAADALAERVAELDLVPLTGEFVAADQDVGRTLLAVIAALASFDLTMTMAGALHRTGLKKLAKQLALEPHVIERCVITALDAELLELDDASALVINRDNVLAAAEGRYPRIGSLEQLRSALERYGAVSQAAIEVFATNAQRRGVSTLGVESIELLPGFCAGTVGTTPALRYTAPAGASAASITPSFEVILPPESRLRDLVRVLECCEISRIDRAIVGRITKASITRAIGRGLSAKEIIAGLTTACRTAVPQNVTTAIADWAGSTIAATIASGTVIAVPPAEEARVRAAFASAHPVTIAPGVLVLADVTERAAAQTLRKLGILDRAVEQPRERPPAPVIAPVSGLPERLVAYRRGDPSEPRLVRVEKSRPKGTAQAAFDPDQALDHELVERLERWEKQHRCHLALDVFDALIEILARFPLQDRMFVFGARSEAELGARMISLLARPATRATIERELIDELAGALGRPLTTDDDLQWDRDHVIERLEAAARVHGKVVLDLGPAGSQTIAVTRVSRRGNALIVLGEDDDDISHAIRIADIVATADPSTASSSATKWRPAPGMAPPAGHVRCPCGSGKRYRECCRVAD